MPFLRILQSKVRVLLLLTHVGVFAFTFAHCARSPAGAAELGGDAAVPVSLRVCVRVLRGPI